MKRTIENRLLCILATALVLCVACASSARERPGATSIDKPANKNGSEPPRSTKPNPGRVIHVLVALCDNQYQGIVPVPARIGNGDDPDNNLYWGAGFGVRTFFSKSPDWSLASKLRNPQPRILERCVFRHKTGKVFLVADAYQGREIKQCTSDFFDFAAGKRVEAIQSGDTEISAGAGSDLIAYVGHDGLMDFQLSQYPDGPKDNKREVVILACASKQYFADPLRRTGARPLLWTTGLMAPEAYVLKAAVDGWVNNEDGASVRARAAKAYNAYQNCGLSGATRLFASGW
jgi:hypothetical protein